MPQVSVIIPTYNRAIEIQRALDSVLAQSFSDWEVVVVDDGSTDDTRAVVDGYASRGIAIHYLWQENKKQATARNLGIRYATGEYIAFLDSDDAWLPEKLAKQVAILDNETEIGMVYGNQLMLDSPKDSGMLRYPPGWLKSGNVFNDLLRRRFYCSMQTVLVRKSVLDEVGVFDEQFANALEDWELTLRISWRHPVAVMDDPVVRRIVNARYSRDYALIRAKNHRAILEKTFSACDVPANEQKQIWKGAWFSWGVSFLENGFYLKSLHCFAQALLRGHRFAAPALFMVFLGPMGRYIYHFTRERD